MSQRLARWLLPAINGEMTVTLTPDNLNYPDVKVGDFDESMNLEEVTNVIHQS